MACAIKHADEASAQHTARPGSVYAFVESAATQSCPSGTAEPLTLRLVAALCLCRVTLQYALTVSVKTKEDMQLSAAPPVRSLWFAKAVQDRALPGACIILTRRRYAILYSTGRVKWGWCACRMCKWLYVFTSIHTALHIGLS